jgi:hypothetical protein
VAKFQAFKFTLGNEKLQDFTIPMNDSSANANAMRYGVISFGEF